VRTARTHAFLKLFDEFDFLIMPSTQITPFPAELDWPHTLNGHTMQSYHEWMKGNLLITMTGQPTLAAPAGFDQFGLPVGLQIIGRNRDEVGCLRLAHGYAQANVQAISRCPSITS
jgi:amidase